MPFNGEKPGCQLQQCVLVWREASGVIVQIWRLTIGLVYIHSNTSPLISLWSTNYPIPCLSFVCGGEADMLSSGSLGVKRAPSPLDGGASEVNERRRFRKRRRGELDSMRVSCRQRTPAFLRDSRCSFKSRVLVLDKVREALTDDDYRLNSFVQFV